MTDKSMPPVASSTPAAAPTSKPTGGEATQAAAPMPKPTGGFYLLNNHVEAIFMAVVLSIFFFFAIVAMVVLIHLILAIHIAIYLCLAGHAFCRYRRNLHPMSPPHVPSLRRRRLRHRAFRPMYHPYGADVSVTGLSVEELLSLSCFVHPGGEVECAVCLEGLRAGDLCRALPGCNHEFHSKCVDRWLVTRPACPVCRRVVAVDGELMQAKARWL